MNTKWLEDFKKYWLEKNIDYVINLFTDDLIYFETPYKRITDKNTLKNEWKYIENHNIKKLDFEVFLENNEKKVIKFEYIYELDWEERKYSWVYLIKIINWKCNYFYQIWE